MTNLSKSMRDVLLLSLHEKKKIPDFFFLFFSFFLLRKKDFEIFFRYLKKNDEELIFSRERRLNIDENFSSGM